jgi:hypothetical protein
MCRSRGNERHVLYFTHCDCDGDNNIDFHFAAVGAAATIEIAGIMVWNP